MRGYSDAFSGLFLYEAVLGSRGLGLRLRGLAGATSDKAERHTRAARLGHLEHHRAKGIQCGLRWRVKPVIGSPSRFSGPSVQAISGAEHASWRSSAACGAKLFATHN